MTSAPEAAASSFETKAGSEPFRRTSSAEAGRPASESEPSATTSSSGWREQPVERLLARCSRSSRGSPAVGMLLIMHIVHIMQRHATAPHSSSRTAPSSRACSSARPASPPARPASRPRWRATRRRPPTRATSRRCSASPIRSSATTASTSARLESERVQAEAIVMRTARPGVGRLAARAGRRRARPTSTRARSSAGSATDGVLRCAVGDAPVAELHARALAEPPIDGRPLDRQRRHARAVLRRRPARASSLVDLGCKRSIPRAARRHRPRGRSSSRATGTPTRSSSAQPRAVLVGNGPGDPAVLHGPIETVRDAARPRAALRHLPRPPAARPRARARHVQAPVRPPRREPSRARRAHRPRARHRAEPRLRGRRPTSDVSHVSLNDGTRRGPRGRRLRERAVPPRGGARPARRPALLRPDGRRMPKRTDLRSILIIGSGPIRIGQACEFDYSGAQACRVLRREGYRVVLVNSNPATIMTDPEWADATYLEPLDVETVREVIDARAARRAAADARRPDRAQPRDRAARGWRARRRRADRRRRRRDPARRGPRALPRDGRAAGLAVPQLGRRVIDRRRLPGARRSCARRSRSAARAAASRTRGTSSRRRRARPRREPGRPGARRGVPRRLAGARARGDVRRARATASSSARSRTSTRWACTPATRGRSRRSRRCPTPSTSGCARRRSRCARAVGVATGGANVQFAYEPETRELARDRDEPARVALVGARVEGDGLPDREARRAARRRLHARRAAERHHAADDGGVRAGARLRRRQGAALRLREVPGRRRRLGTEMRAVGEALGLGRTFPEAFLKALHGRESPRVPSTTRPRRGAASRCPSAGTCCSRRRGGARSARHPPVLRRRAARSPRRAAAARRSGADARREGHERGRGLPGRLAVDSCAGGVRGADALLLPLVRGRGRRAAAVGQRGDRARLAARTGSARGSSSTTAACTRRRRSSELGYEAVLVNSNPETVSTDYDTSDRLYLEPLTLERALDVCELEQPLGVVVSFGGQTPLRLAPALAAAGRAAARRPARRDRRRRGSRPLRASSLGELAPEWGAAEDADEARAIADADRLSGARPAASRARRARHARRARRAASSPSTGRASSTAISRARSSSTSTCSATASGAWVGGDPRARRACGRPLGRLRVRASGAVGDAARSRREFREVATRDRARRSARAACSTCSSRSSAAGSTCSRRTRARRGRSPFVAKATGVPLVEHACRLLLGEPLARARPAGARRPTRAWAKEAMFPAERFAGAAARGPEMRSTGEVMARRDRRRGLPPRPARGGKCAAAVA